MAKTRLQAGGVTDVPSEPLEAGAVAPKKKERYSGAIDCLTQVYQAKGVAGWYQVRPSPLLSGRQPQLTLKWRCRACRRKSQRPSFPRRCSLESRTHLRLVRGLPRPLLVAQTLTCSPVTDVVLALIYYSKASGKAVGVN